MDAAGAAASYGTYQRVAEDGRCLNLVVPPASLSHRDMLKSNRIGHSTGIYDRHAVGDGARFQPIGHEDYAFWLDLLHQGGPAVGVGGSEPVARYLVRAGSISRNNAREEQWQWQIYRRHQVLGMRVTAWQRDDYATRPVTSTLLSRATPRDRHT